MILKLCPEKFRIHFFLVFLCFVDAADTRDTSQSNSAFLGEVPEDYNITFICCFTLLNKKMYCVRSFPVIQTSSKTSKRNNWYLPFRKNVLVEDFMCSWGLFGPLFICSFYAFVDFKLNVSLLTLHLFLIHHPIRLLSEPSDTSTSPFLPPHLVASSHC